MTAISAIKNDPEIKNLLLNSINMAIWSKNPSLLISPLVESAVEAGFVVITVNDMADIEAKTVAEQLISDSFESIPAISLNKVKSESEYLAGVTCKSLIDAATAKENGKKVAYLFPNSQSLSPVALKGFYKLVTEKRFGSISIGADDIILVNCDLTAVENNQIIIPSFLLTSFFNIQI